MSDIDKDIEDKAQKVQEHTPDQHLGDAMDDADPQDAHETEDDADEGVGVEAADPKGGSA